MPRDTVAKKAAPGGRLTEAALRKMPASQYMNEQQLAFFRHQLQQMQQRILDNATNTSEHLREHEAEADIADQATIEEEYALELRARDRERLLARLMAPVEVDEEDQAIAAQLVAEKSPEEIAAALVRAYRAALPDPEELIEATPEARRERGNEGHRPGFDEAVWFRMNIGKRHNADPRWILPLLCRKGHVTRAEVGAIRIAPGETWFQVPQGVAAKFASAIARAAGPNGEDEDGIRLDRWFRLPRWPFSWTVPLAVQAVAAQEAMALTADLEQVVQDCHLLSLDLL